MMLIDDRLKWKRAIVSASQAAGYALLTYQRFNCANEIDLIFYLNNVEVCF